MWSAAAAAFVALPAVAADCSLQSGASGLQYCDLKEGSGPTPAKGALIRCARRWLCRRHMQSFKV